MADVTFIVHSEWLDNIAGLSIEQQDQIIAEIIRYGTGLELQHQDDPIIQAFVNMVKSRIDFSKDKYAAKIEGGTNSGRKKRIDDVEVYNMAREGKNSAQIAEIIGCSKSTIDHCDGWKRRKDEVDFRF